MEKIKKKEYLLAWLRCMDPAMLPLARSLCGVL